MDQGTIVCQTYHLFVMDDDINRVRQAIKEAEITQHFSVWHNVATIGNYEM